MFLFKNKKPKIGLRIKTRHRKVINGELREEVKQMFIGHHTIFSLVGLVVGGSLVGKTLWEWLVQLWGLPATFFIGMVVFIASGLVLHTFDDRKGSRTAEEEESLNTIIRAGE